MTLRKAASSALLQSLVELSVHASFRTAYRRNEQAGKSTRSLFVRNPASGSSQNECSGLVFIGGKGRELLSRLGRCDDRRSVPWTLERPYANWTS